MRMEEITSHSAASFQIMTDLFKMDISSSSCFNQASDLTDLSDVSDVETVSI